jgi:hypothetical protein
MRRFREAKRRGLEAKSPKVLERKPQKTFLKKSFLNLSKNFNSKGASAFAR